MREPDEQQSAPRKAGVLQVARAVFWSFLGIRKSRDHDRDAVSITPLQIVVAGVIGAAILVFCLIMLVRVVTR
jgi:Protein of unknown function (DUF2970)